MAAAHLIRRCATHWRNGLAGACLSVLLGLCFLVFPIGDGLTNLSYDLPFYFRPDIPVDEVAIVYMDQPSHQLLKQPFTETWDRTLYAQLLERLSAGRAKAVVFDLLFDTPTTNDERFVRAAKAHGKVAVGALRKPRDLGGGTVVWGPSPPIEALQAVAAWGMVEEGDDADLAIRRHYQGEPMIPSLAWKVAALTMTKPPPPAPPRARWLNYYGPPLALPGYSFHQVLSNAVPAAAFSNKVVYVGARVDVGLTGGKGADDFRTPYSRWTRTRSPGVEINATAYLNLLRGDWLTRLSPAAEFWLCIFAGILFGYGLATCPAMTAAGLAAFGSAAAAGLAMLLAWRTHVWFAWLIVAGVQIPAALCWSILSHTRRLRFEKEVLEATLAATQSLKGMQAPAAQPQPAAAPVPAPVLPALAPGVSSFFNSPGAAAHAAGFPRAAMPNGMLTIPDHVLVRPIGRGAYGEVWLARDIIGTYHAVKIVYRDSFKDAAPFDREFNGLKRFTPISRSHPGFVHVLHVGRNDEAGCLYYIMEAGDDEVSGQKIDPNTYSPKNLARELNRRKKLPLPECVDLGIKLAEALQYLHGHQLIHRDIKPSNIIFVNGAPKFADIGLVTDVAGTGRDVTIVGTPTYLPPEGPGTPAADVFSLGKVIYEAGMGLDSGSFPDLPSSLLGGTGNRELFELNKIILRACEPEARKRYQTAAELHAALRQLHEQIGGKKI